MINYSTYHDEILSSESSSILGVQSRVRFLDGADECLFLCVFVDFARNSRHRSNPSREYSKSVIFVVFKNNSKLCNLRVEIQELEVGLNAR